MNCITLPTTRKLESQAKKIEYGPQEVTSKINFDAADHSRNGRRAATRKT